LGVALGGIGLGAAPVTGPAADLNPETSAAFQRYVRGAETHLEERVAGGRTFLWTDEAADRLARIRRGEVVTERTAGAGPVSVPNGLIHDFTGAVFIRGVTLRQTLAFVQDYDHHKDYYGPEVVDSKILAREGDHFVLYMRLEKRKVITVVLDTVHDATFAWLDRSRCYSRSRTTKTAEVEDAGRASERVLPEGTGHGFMWNLNSYWRFAERDGGVWVECQAVSLSRGIPLGLGWLLGPLVNDLPRESLERTLVATRAGILSRTAKTR
jgi:hypothetical protein